MALLRIVYRHRFRVHLHLFLSGGIFSRFNSGSFQLLLEAFDQVVEGFKLGDALAIYSTMTATL